MIGSSPRCNCRSPVAVGVGANGPAQGQRHASPHPTDQRHHPHSRGHGIAKIHETEEGGSMRWCGGAMLLLSLEVGRGGGGVEQIGPWSRKEIIPGRRLRRPCQVAGDGESSPHVGPFDVDGGWWMVDSGEGPFSGHFPPQPTFLTLGSGAFDVPGVHAAPTFSPGSPKGG